MKSCFTWSYLDYQHTNFGKATTIQSKNKKNLIEDFPFLKKELIQQLKNCKRLLKNWIEVISVIFYEVK